MASFSCLKKILYYVHLISGQIELWHLNNSVSVRKKVVNATFLFVYWRCMQLHQRTLIAWLHSRYQNAAKQDQRNSFCGLKSIDIMSCMPTICSFFPLIKLYLSQEWLFPNWGIQTMHLVLSVHLLSSLNCVGGKAFLRDLRSRLFTFVLLPRLLKFAT